MFDASWMVKKTGKVLMKEAEAIVSQCLLKIDGADKHPYYFEAYPSSVIKEFGHSKPPVSVLLGLWRNKFETVHDLLPAALCVST